MKINLSPTCANSPKNKFAQDFTIKLLSFNFHDLNSMAVDNISLFIPDQASIQGKATLKDFMKYLDLEIQVLSIISSISHGKYAAVLAEFSDGEKDYMISIHYLFENNKAKLIDSATILIVEKIKTV